MKSALEPAFRTPCDAGAPDRKDRPRQEQGRREKLREYALLLAQANTRLNLTALRDPGHLWKRHIEESIRLGPWLPRKGLVMDLGSGGGAPGIPLAIVCPGVRMVLMEATGKKATFLRAAVRDLDLGNTVVLEGRAETWGRSSEHRGRYDVIVARAVAALPELLELAVPFLKIGGCLLAIKGARVREEIVAAAGALRALGARLAEVARPDGAADPLVVRIHKTAATPDLYPRRPGMPRKRPLAG